MDLIPVMTEAAKTLGPTGALAGVLFTMWFRSMKRNGKPDEARSEVRKIIAEDHDVLTRIETNVQNITEDITEIKSDVKGLIKDSHTHLAP